MKMLIMKAKVEILISVLRGKDENNMDYNNLLRMRQILEDQIAGVSHSGYRISRGILLYASNPNSREEVLRFFPGILGNVEI
jgi:hypothetical protein